jgi:uncharacterized protein
MPRKKRAKQLKGTRPAVTPSNIGEMRGAPEPFWRSKSLTEMSAEEWELLCDGCGQCCLIKLEDEDTGDIAVTRLACKLLDLGTCRCSDYGNRRRHVPDCVKLTPEDIGGLRWLPFTCAYRTLDEGRDLPWWHPLISGSDATVHEAGVSIRGIAISEAKVPVHRYPAHIAGWLEQG